MSWLLLRKKAKSEKPGFLRLFRAIIPAAALLCSLASAGISSAGKVATEQPLPTAEPPPAVETAPTVESGPPLEFVPGKEFAPSLTPPLSEEPFFEPMEKRIEATADKTHEIVQRNLLEQVIRLDNFYGTTRTGSRRQTGYEVRLRSAFRVGTDGNFEYGPSIRANITPAKISEKLRLTIAGDNEPTPVTPSLPEDPGNPGFDRISGNNTRLVNTELRYRMIESPSMNLFLGA